jgi:hypothetical protein
MNVYECTDIQLLGGTFGANVCTVFRIGVVMLFSKNVK